MTLKDDMARDIDGVFLNEEEFAEPRRVAGREIVCVFYETATAQADEDYGRSFKSYTLQAKSSDLPALRVGDALTVDGKAYTVANVRTDYGMTITELDYTL